MRKLFILFIILQFLIGCDKEVDACQNGITNTEQISLEVDQMQYSILDITTEEALLKFIEKEPIVADYFLKRGNYPNDSIMANVLVKRFNNPYIDTLAMEIKEVFGNAETLIKEFNDAFSTLNYYYPESKMPKIKFVATGLENGADLYVSDSLIVIGLDFYLGKTAKYRPLGFPQYLLQKYTPEYIVPSVMLLYGISPQFNSGDPADKTILADMISYGKAYYFAKSMLPCVADSTIIGYTSEEMTGSQSNIGVIWAHFLDNELLYSQDNFLKQKYLGERPKTYEIGDKCPGRIGTWLGWYIVSAYTTRKELSLQELMQKDNAQKIFQESKFRPNK